MWSVGGSCDADSREKFSEFVRVTVAGKLEEHPIPVTVGKWECPMDEKGLVYDYFYEVLCNYNTHICSTCFKTVNQPIISYSVQRKR